MIKQYICWENRQENGNAATKSQTIQVQDDFFTAARPHGQAKNILIWADQQAASSSPTARTQDLSQFPQSVF